MKRERLCIIYMKTDVSYMREDVSEETHYYEKNRMKGRAGED